MWQLLFRKTRADLRSRPFQFLLTGLLLACSAAGITLGLTVRDAADRPWERAFEAGNGPHMWMSSPQAEPLDTVAGLPEVAEAGPVMRSAGEFSSLSTEQKPDVYLLEAPADDGQFIGKPLMTEGRWLDPGAASPQAVIGAGTARELGLQPGDIWTVGGHGREVNFEVVGIGVLTFRAPYPTWSPVFAYVSTAGFDELMAEGVDLRLRRGVRLHDPYSTPAVLNRLEAMQAGAGGVGIITWQAVLEGVNEDFLFHQITFFIFGTLTAVASIVVVMNTIAGQVIAQSREIGVLKTVGMTPGGVLRVFVLQNVAVALVAGLAGTAAGIALGQLVVLRNSALFGGAVVGVPWASVVVVLTVTVVIATLAAIVPAWRAGRAPVTGTVVGHGAASRRRMSLPAVSKALSRFPSLSSGTRLVWASRSRALLTVTAIVVTVISSTLLLGFNKLLFDRESYELLGAPPADVLVEQVGGGRPEGLEAVVRDARVERAYTYMTFVAQRQAGRAVETLAVRGFGEGFASTPWRYLAGGAPQDPGEALIGWQLAERAGLRPGDTFELSNENGRAVLTVAGVFTLDDNGGNAVWMHIDDARASLAPDAYVTHAGLTLRRGTDEEAFASSLRNSDAGNYDVVLVREEVRRELGQFAPAIYTLSAVMLAIATLSVLSSTMLTVRERLRDIASLKAAGMTPAQVVCGITLAVVGLAVAGLAVGVPLGLLVNQQVMLFIGEEAGTAADLTADPSLLWVAALCAIVAAVAAAAAFVPARTGGRVAVTEALRYE